jgi:hypothetical protein
LNLRLNSAQFAAKQVMPDLRPNKVLQATAQQAAAHYVLQ